MSSCKSEIIVTHLDFSIKYTQGSSKVQKQISKFKYIKNVLDSFLHEYPCRNVYIEGSFVRKGFLNSSEVVIKFHGFLMLYFIDKEIDYYPPKTIRKGVLDNGNGTKEDIFNFIEENYNIKCMNYDQSDSFAIMLYEHKLHGKEVGKNIKVCNGGNDSIRKS